MKSKVCFVFVSILNLLFNFEVFSKPSVKHKDKARRSAGASKRRSGSAARRSALGSAMRGKSKDADDMSKEDKGKKETDETEFEIKSKKRKEAALAEETARKKRQDNLGTCEEKYYECMDNKTAEMVQFHEVLYNDYSDMLTDIYSGMRTPAFKCIYDPKIKEMYSKYYYGLSSISNSSFIDKVSSGSIEYYNYLKENANNVATKKISPMLLNKDVIKIANLPKEPKGNAKFVDRASVSYKIATLDPERILQDIDAHCANVVKNPDLKICDKNDLEFNKDDWKEKWLNINTPTIEASCKDYGVFLKEKLIKSKKEASDFISLLSNKLTSVIEEHNLKVESDLELEVMKAKEEAETILKEEKKMADDEYREKKEKIDAIAKKLLKNNGIDK